MPKMVYAPRGWRAFPCWWPCPGGVGVIHAQEFSPARLSRPAHCHQKQRMSPGTFTKAKTTQAIEIKKANA